MGRRPNYKTKLPTSEEQAQFLQDMVKFSGTMPVVNPRGAFNRGMSGFAADYRRGRIVMTALGEERKLHLIDGHLGGPKNVVRCCWAPVAGLTMEHMREIVELNTQGSYTMEQCHVTAAVYDVPWFVLDRNMIETINWNKYITKDKLADMRGSEFDELAPKMSENLAAILSHLGSLEDLTP